MDRHRIPKLNKASYIDTRAVYELPLECLNQQRDGGGRAWHLRECSFALLSDMAKDAIAQRMLSWRPCHENEMLCQKLDPANLQEGTVCWVEPISKKLTDKDGTSYEGCGPCIILKHTSEFATICVVSA